MSGSKFFTKASKVKERVSKLRRPLNSGDMFTVYYYDDINNTENDNPFYHPQLVKIQFTVKSYSDGKLVVTPNESLTVDTFKKMMINCDDSLVQQGNVIEIVFDGIIINDPENMFRGGTRLCVFQQYLLECLNKPNELKRGDKIHVVNKKDHTIDIQIVRIVNNEATYDIDFIVLNFAEPEDFDGVEIELVVNDRRKVCWGSISISD